MRNRLMAMNFQSSPRPAGVPLRAEPSPRKTAARTPESAPRRPGPSRIQGFLEIVSETLWIGLLLMVIGFLAWKFPQISSAVDEISGNTRHEAASADEPAQARMRELETRISGYETKLGPIERNYAQLKQRHSDLQKAYDALRTASVRDAYVQRAENSRPTAAP